MSNPVTTLTPHELQTADWMGWLDHCRLVKDLTAQLAAKDAEILTLQPGYVAPESPTVEKRVADAIDSVLTEEEKVTYAEAVSAISFAPKAKPVEIGLVEKAEP